MMCPMQSSPSKIAKLCRLSALDALTKVSIENQVLGSFWPIVDVVAGITAKGILTSGSSRIWNLLYNLGVRGLWGPYEIFSR